MSEFDIGLPSARLIQNFIQDKQEVELKLIAGDTLSGTIFWQDQYCICLRDSKENPTVIWRHALAYIKPKG